MCDVRDHLARERRLSRWLVRVRAGEPVECRAKPNPPPPPPRARRERVDAELKAKTGGEWTRGDRV